MKIGEYTSLFAGGVILSYTPFNMQADLYLHVREKEGRLYDDKTVAALPGIPSGHPLAHEWALRKLSASRLTRYLSRRRRPLTILDLGCGNGWLSNHLSRVGHHVFGADMNMFELRQAARVFAANHSPDFVFADVFSAPFATRSFDVILLASVVQYFPSLSALVAALLPLLKPMGCIHIIDSPFYAEAEQQNAKTRTRQYYASLGLVTMAEFYHHHQLSELASFSPQVLYQPNVLLGLIGRLLRIPVVPFPWLVINK